MNPDKREKKMMVKINNKHAKDMSTCPAPDLTVAAYSKNINKTEAHAYDNSPAPAQQQGCGH